MCQRRSWRYLLPLLLLSLAGRQWNHYRETHSLIHRLRSVGAL